MAQLIDGKGIAAKIRAQVAERAKDLKATRHITPGLAVIRVGEDPASKIYVGSKRKAAEEIGFHSWEHHFPAGASQQEVLAQVEKLNRDSHVHGILVQLPLPPQINADQVISAVDPAKDVDGLHPINAANLFLGRPGVRPCTPAGIMRLLLETGFRAPGKRAIVVGRSNLVGKPTAMLLLAANATVTLCHRQSRLEEVVPEADLVVAAAGMPELVKGLWIKPGSVVIDVGVNRTSSGKLLGDVEFEVAAQRAALITPVPGGVGPMTVAMLMENTLSAAMDQDTRT